MGSSYRFSFIILITIIAAALLAGCQNQTSDIQSTARVVDSVASADGLMIYYDTQGTGDKALVFVHGWCCNRTFWTDQADHFATDYRVVTIDLGGHGESGLDRQGWTVPAFGADVAAVVEKLDLKQVIMIGHSMGGAIIIEAARNLAARGLADRAVAVIGVDNFQTFNQNFSLDEINSFLDRFRTDFAAETNTFVRRMFPLDADTALVDRVAAVMSSASPEMGIEVIGNVLAYDYITALTEMRLPVRSISGDRFPTDVSGNDTIATSFEARYMSGRGHFLQMEDPVTFNKLLEETLAEFWPKPAE